MPSRGQVSQSCCINIFSCMLQDPHSRQQQQQQPPHPPSSARQQQQQQQQRGVRRQTTPGRPHPGSQPREKPPPEPEPSAAKLNLAGIVWRKVLLAAAAAVKDWEVHNTMHRGDTLRWLLCRQICVPNLSTAADVPVRVQARARKQVTIAH